MTIQALLELAQNSELHNVGYKNNTTMLLGYMNLGLIELYKRFPLQVDEAIITLDGTRQYYKLDGTDSAVEMPANSEYMWIIAAYAEVPDYSTTKVILLPVNDEDTGIGVNSVSWNTIQIPTTIAGEVVSIIYAAGPRLYTLSDLSAELPVPLQFTEALLHYIGYRAHGAMNGAIEAETNTHYQRFEASCGRIITQGMYTPDSLEMHRDMKGFV